MSRLWPNTRKPSVLSAVARIIHSPERRGAVDNTAWTLEELAYLAGIIDGEGCISLSTGKTSRRIRHSTQVFIGNTDERLIHWLHQRFGGSIGVRQRQNASHKPLWYWLVSGAAIEPILRATLPYLRLKHAQACLVLEYRSTIAPIGSNQPTPVEVVSQREQLKSNLSVLNHRGVA